VVAGLACVWVLAGAVYFGLWSCGNHAWKSDLFRLMACALTLAAVAWPGRRLSTLSRRLLFPLILWAAYVLLESAVAPFYPAMPVSWQDYVETFRAVLGAGPCR
jgi:hypothetical protein